MKSNYSNFWLTQPKPEDIININSEHYIYLLLSRIEWAEIWVFEKVITRLVGNLY